MQYPDAEKALEDAKVGLIFRPDSVFITSVLYGLECVFDETIPTAGTNGIKILINPQFLVDFTHDHRMFLMFHETMHVVLQHIFRKGERDHRDWNKACDYAINLMAYEAGYDVPKCALFDLGYKGMAAEEIYEQMPKNQTEDQDNFIPDMYEPDKDDVPEEIVAQVNTIIVQAAIQAESAKQHGSIPGEVKRYIDELINPTLPWEVILQNHLNERSVDDYSYLSPNRQYLPDLYMPSLVTNEGLEHICIIVDISCSVTDEDFAIFISEIRQLYQQFEPEKITVVSFDTRIREEYTIESDAEMEALEFTGGGGTSISPVMDYIDKHRPNATVILTDGYFSPVPAPQVPLYWVIYDNPKFTYDHGIVIHYDKP